jgi:aspartyl-tRNA(Asn)/glutamyl-tRNA(Gln) amidotransferase subunit A
MIREKIYQLKSQNISAEENVQHYLDKIRCSDLNAFIDVNDNLAIEQARKVDRKIKNNDNGCLSGLVLGIKSNINVDGYRATCASKTLENYVCPYDAEVIKRIKKQDGIIIGMTNMDEFACGSSGEMSYFGPTKNPNAKDYVTGGSSSGSAAAVAGGLCDMALGSDTGGSIRNPASHCGAVGVKPTYGLVPREGLIDLAMSLEQIGPVSRDVYGTALLLKTIAGHNERECTTLDVDIPDYTKCLEKDLKGLKIGTSKQFERVTDDRINKIINRSTDKLISEFNLEKVDVNLPHVDKALVTYYPIVFVEFFSATRKFDGRRYGHKIEDVCLEEVGRRMDIGSFISQKEEQGKYYKKALQARGIIKDAFSQAFKECDVLLSATVPKLPHKIGERIPLLDMYSYDMLTTPANLSGICSGVVPTEKIDGIPVGLQIQADKLQEPKMFSVMAAWEKIRGNGHE